MTKIKVTAEGSWRFLFNGEEVAASDNTNGADNMVIQTDAPWAITVDGAGVASSEDAPAPEPEPEPGELPKIPTELIDRALDFAMPKYGNSGNSSSNVGSIGTALLTTIYAYNGGDKRSQVRANVEAILEALTGDNGPCGMNGPGAAQESYALAWFHLYRASDLWADTPDATKDRIDAIFGALAVIRAWEGNDGSPSNGEWTITGGRDLDYKDVGPNISYSIPGQLVLIGEWFGYDALEGWLDEASIADVRAAVEEAFGGTGGRLYKTLNWRNETIDAAEAEDYYRSGPSDDTPTDAQINEALPGLRYYGAPISDLPAFLFPRDDRGLNKVMPPSRYTQGSNDYVGVNQYAVDGNKGMTVNGNKRGYCLGDGPSMPHQPGEGAMPYELNGTDEGGIRSAMGYAWWTIYLVNCHFVSMAVNHTNGLLADPAFVDFLARWRQAYDIMKFFDQEDYDSIAHAKSKANGGPGPIVWSEGRDDWEPDLNFFFWDTILQLAGV